MIVRRALSHYSHPSNHRLLFETANNQRSKRGRLFYQLCEARKLALFHSVNTD